jgi:Protein of unknown function (DUF1688)
MSAPGSAGDEPAGGVAELRYLRSPRGVRERCEAIYAMALRGELRHWAVDESRLDSIARRVVQTTRAAYPDVRAIPGHSRWTHFSAGAVDRVRALDERLDPSSDDERLAARFDLVITSVLLDAGAGDRWRYRAAGGATYSRSEGIAVASYDLFVAGAFSSDPDRAPLRADGVALERATPALLAAGLQVGDDNPIVGLEGRAVLLQRLGEVVRSRPEWGGRLGGFGIQLRRAARAGEIPAATVLVAVLEALGSIWPGREVCAGQNLGDVWTHSRAGRVPLHKLSQWLTYSLFEPLERSGVSIVAPAELTGLAEYRNGGLFVDGGALVPRHDGVLRDEHEVGSDVVIEWRALTLPLLDRTAERVRAVMGLSPTELPLAKVLEGGTWRAGRELAAERRAGGGPPLRVRSDGTVF